MRSPLLVLSIAIAGLIGFAFYAQRTTAQSASPGCRGAAAWLTESNNRTDPIVPFLFADLTLLEEPEEFRALLTEALEAQQASAPPTAATALNSQLISTLALFIATIDRSETSEEVTNLAEYETDWRDATRRIRTLARELKKTCSLTTSGEFFDAPCYGEAASSWHQRTVMRSTEYQSHVAEAERKLAAGLSLEEETALANQLVRETDELRQEQASEFPPPEFSALQGHFVNLFSTLTKMWAQAMTADEAMWQSIEAELATLTLALQREQAQLDINCPFA